MQTLTTKVFHYRDNILLSKYGDIAVFPILSPVVAFNALVLPLFGHAQLSLLYVYGASLMALLYSLYYMGKHRDGLWIFGVVFCFFYMFVLVWQTYYALFTVRRNHWGTR